MHLRALTMFAGLLAFVWTSGAAVRYDSTNRCLWVVDFPEEAPATLDSLLQADREQGWGCVSYTPDTDTYAVDAAIWIGDKSGYSTTFQLGDRDHPKARLVLKGSLWVRPAAAGILRSDGSPSIMNALLAGDPDDGSITPSVLFDCGRAGEHGLYGGRRHGTRIDDTCLIRMFNTTVAPLRDGDPACRWGSSTYLRPGQEKEAYTLGCYTSALELRGCRFSGFAGTFLYGVNTAHWSRKEFRMVPDPRYRIRGCVFENGTSPLAAYQQLTECVFRNVFAPVKDSGSVYLRAIRCTLEDNVHHWYTGGHSARGFDLIDCRIGTRGETSLLKPNTRTDPRRGIPLYPEVRMMRSLRVRVEDEAGRPVPVAAVEVTGSGPVLHARTFTGKDGMTGDSVEANAVCLTVQTITATDDPAQPVSKEDFRYLMRAFGQGREGQRTLHSHDVDGPVVVTLK